MALNLLRCRASDIYGRIISVAPTEFNILLILGGDKKGNSRYYQEMIPQVEKLYKIYLSKMK